MAARLRTVAPGEAAPKTPKTPKPKTVAEAAASGSHRDLLVAMRERIAKTVSDTTCPPRDLAALTRRLQDIAREIEHLDVRADEEGAARGNVEDEAFDSSAV